MRTKQAASIAQARGPPAKQIKTMKQILDQPLNMPALRIDLNNKWSIQRERYLFESPHRESYEQQRLQHVDVLSYVLHDRCGNELHHLGKSYTHPTVGGITSLMLVPQDETLVLIIHLALVYVGFPGDL